MTNVALYIDRIAGVESGSTSHGQARVDEVAGLYVWGLSKSTPRNISRLVVRRLNYTYVLHIPDRS